MTRQIPWRPKVSSPVCLRQSQALASTFYILREIGPTAFLVKEDDCSEKVKVFLGDPHSCSCATFRKEKELCVHILWILLKKFHLSAENPITFQLGLIEREIQQLLLANKTAVILPPIPVFNKECPLLQQRTVSDGDLCPICQELLNVRPLLFCKHGCGNSVHLKCMIIWADHQRCTGENVTCPFCRENFDMEDVSSQHRNKSEQKMLLRNRKNAHTRTICKNCQMAPIVGSCYRCQICHDCFLCQKCFSSSNHDQHPFYFRQNKNNRWLPASQSLPSSLPEGIINHLMDREITEDDYELLMQLDANAWDNCPISEYKVNNLPVKKLCENHLLVTSNQQCPMCLKNYEPHQYIRLLPCGHKFHRLCIDNWLLHRSSACPLDGKVVHNLQTHKKACYKIKSHKVPQVSDNLKDCLQAQSCGKSDSSFNITQSCVLLPPIKKIVKPIGRR